MARSNGYTIDYSDLEDQFRAMGEARVRWTRKHVRNAVGAEIVQRVLARGRAGTDFLGRTRSYSTKRTTVYPSSNTVRGIPKPMRVPAGVKQTKKGGYAFPEGQGYAAYRRACGLQTGRWDFRNTGNFWNDFDYEHTQNPNTPFNIGFENAANAELAMMLIDEEAIDFDFFSLNEKDWEYLLDFIADMYENTMTSGEATRSDAFWSKRPRTVRPRRR